MIPQASRIEVMDRAALVATWSDLMKAPVPPRLSLPMLRRMLAFEVQVRRYGGLPKGFAAKLQRAARPANRTAEAAPKPGARLMREWNGVTHVVDVHDDGFVWRGETYRSLSAIARAITGARWSGPRFFGLTGSGRR